jgi:hypothetical protein
MRGRRNEPILSFGIKDLESECFRMMCNRDGAAPLGAAAAELGVPIIHVSTDCVFDGRKDAPYGEEDTRTAWSSPRRRGDRCRRCRDRQRGRRRKYEGDRAPYAFALLGLDGQDLRSWPSQVLREDLAAAAPEIKAASDYRTQDSILR